MTLRIFILSSLLVSASAMAQQPPAGGPPPGGGSSGSKGDFSLAFKEIDTNKDGFISKEEWFAAGASQGSYDGLFVNMLDGNKDGKVTFVEFTATTPMFDVDLDKDGKVSAAEFIKVNNQKGEERKQGGGGPAPAAAP